MKTWQQFVEDIDRWGRPESFPQPGRFNRSLEPEKEDVTLTPNIGPLQARVTVNGSYLTVEIDREAKTIEDSQVTLNPNQMEKLKLFTDLG